MNEAFLMNDEMRYVSEQEPFPWLLEKSNPSARFLTLRDLFDSNTQDPQTAAAQEAIPAWEPVARILAAVDSVDFWGRNRRPFYGGAISTQATLCLLADLGLPKLELIRAACENLLEYGQLEAGGFTYDGAPDHMMLCYTGTSVTALTHFGFGEDERVSRALDYLAERATSAGGGSCPFCETESCQWGMTKSLGAFAAPPRDRLIGGWALAAESLADSLLSHEFEFDGRDANWLNFGFPHHYGSDLTELVDVVARLGYGADPRADRLMKQVTAARSDDGRWIKGQGTHALFVEQRGAPSKWITIRVLRATRHVTRARAATARTSLHNPAGE